MRIAFVSYEYPPDTALGGIATYVAHAARALAQAGHEVEVFCGSRTRSASLTELDGLIVHRIRSDRPAFATAVVPLFVQRHRRAAFDVVEGPDHLAEARYVVRALPHLPYVVKLHTLNSHARKFAKLPLTRENFRSQIRLLWYVAKTRNVRALGARPNPFERDERQHVLGADEIAAPTLSVANTAIRHWGAEPERMALVPYIYSPSPDLTSIPTGTTNGSVTFIGRLDWRRGVQDLAEAIPLILEKNPSTRFLFVGAWGASPAWGLNMKEYLCRRMSQECCEKLDFTGRVPAAAIPRYLSQTDICVFPSRWEGFGFPVLEAMAAGRGIVCTGNSGMAEVVDDGEYGVLVPPKSPTLIAERVSHLLATPAAREELGRKAREEGLRRFSPAAVVPTQLQSYERAIARRQALLSKTG